VSREQPARNRWDIEIFWEIRRKVQKNEGVACAIGGRTGTFCRTDRPMRDLHSLPFHYRSGAMRTELGDQQYDSRTQDAIPVLAFACAIPSWLEV